MLEKGGVTGRTKGETGRGLREEGDGVWEGRRWDQTAGDDLKWYKENFERQEEHIGIFFGFFNGI